jgi:uncharacterized caspase-like protein
MFPRFSACFLFIVSVVVSTVAYGEKNVALVIGNGAYLNVGLLPNPVSDATEVASLLKKMNFDVTLATNIGLKDMVDSLKAFEDKASAADVAVVYFAGHGLEINGTNWLVPIDAQLKRDTHIDVETISLEKIRVTIEGARRLRLIILDACRDNPFLKTMSLSSRSTLTRGLARVEADGSEVIAYSAKEGTVAADGIGGNSPFTAALLKHLNEPGIDVRFLFGTVRDEVLASTKTAGRPQEPVLYQNLGGQVTYLVPPASGESRASESSDALAREDFNLAKQLGTPEAWEAFLRQHPSGFLADIAKSEKGRVSQPAKPADVGAAIIDAPLTPKPDPTSSAALSAALPEPVVLTKQVDLPPHEPLTAAKVSSFKVKHKQVARLVEERPKPKTVVQKPKSRSCFSFGGSKYCN